MVRITARYEGDLRCIATHQPSGTTLTTDAPRDNEGKGESFSPTDLVATGQLVCVMTILGIVARRHGFDIRGATGEVDKGMVADPRRIGALPVTIRLPASVPEAHRKTLEAAGRTCPVSQSIHPGIDAPIRFVYA